MIPIRYFEPSLEPTFARTSRAVAVSICVLGLTACSQPPLGPLEVVELDTPAGEFSGQAHLATASDGTAVVSWLEPTIGEAMGLMYSSLAAGSTTWSEPAMLSEGEDWFINWADFPSVVPMTDSLWAAHWLVFREDFDGYDIVVALSSDRGGSWTDPFVLNTDGLPAEHGFVTLYPYGDNIAAVWLDGRTMFIDGEFAFETPAGEKLGTSLRYALFDAAGQRLVDESIDDMVCDCCQPDIAFPGDEPILIYRDRTPDEVRDIVVRRMVDGEWQSLQALPADNWTIEACPINGPAIAADGNDVVAAWFSAPDDEPMVRFARSSDGGATFGDAVDVDTEGSFGYVDVELLANGDGVVSWLRSSGDDLALVTRRISESGELHPVEEVTIVDLSRPLDFPQMMSAGDRLVFLWTDYTSGSDVKTGIGRYGQ